jgi:formate hydrogenlyase subunit 3/multisubunit Na+/H+ antiporter MnhD subunit
MSAILSYPLFKVDALSGFTAVAAGIFFVLTVVYSLSFMKGKPGSFKYYTFITLTAAAGVLAVLANNLVLLLSLWGFLGLTLFLLIGMGEKGSHLAAKKTLVIVGGSDALMILGFALIYSYSGSLQIDKIRLGLDSWPMVLAYVCVAIGCFAKAGVMPFHSWIPDSTEKAPLPVVAFIIASLDKILGIYLLFRVSLSMFVMNRAMNNLLMCVGAFTIIAAVFLQLVQGNLKKLLGYCAVSQVGYIVLGIGTGNPIGIAGGLFHMLNHTVYKTCLFFTAGNVEYRAKTCDLDKLGGLSKFMPITYSTCLIASLSVSGIPPLNGFVSKWFVFQGLISGIQEANSLAQSLFVAICLSVAMFGSVLTLASFIKLLHAVFLGERLNNANINKITEAPWQMILPCIVLSVLCVLFGIFAFTLPLKYLIFPAVSLYYPINNADILGSWQPGLAMLLVTLALIIGWIVFKLSRLKLAIRQDAVFSGGEAIERKEENMVTGTDFYNSVKEVWPLNKIYNKAQAGVFDIYEQGKKIFSLSRPLQYLHNGVLPTYMVWMLLGMVGLFLFLLK